MRSRTRWRWWGGVLLVLLLPGLLPAQQIIRDQTDFRVTVTDESQTVTAPGPAWAFVRNDGAADLHVNFAGTPATTDHFLLPAGAGVGSPVLVRAVSLICASGQTTTAEVVVIRGAP